MRPGPSALRGPSPAGPVTVAAPRKAASGQSGQSRSLLPGPGQDLPAAKQVSFEVTEQESQKVEGRRGATVTARRRKQALDAKGKPREVEKAEAAKGGELVVVLAPTFQFVLRELTLSCLSSARLLREGERFIRLVRTSRIRPKPGVAVPEAFDWNWKEMPCNMGDFGTELFGARLRARQGGHRHDSQPAAAYRGLPQAAKDLLPFPLPSFIGRGLDGTRGRESSLTGVAPHWPLGDQPVCFNRSFHSLAGRVTP